MRAMNFFRRLWRDEEGQTTTEYILILSVVVLIALKFKNQFAQSLNSQIGKLGSQMDQITTDQ